MTAAIETPPPSNFTLEPPNTPPKENRAWLIAGVVVILLATFLRFWDLGSPSRCYFDETYYYYDARDVQANGVEAAFVVHPPIGKQLIALGLDIAGVDRNGPIEKAVVDDPHSCVEDEQRPPNPAARAREAADAWGRRIISALFGSLAVLVTWLAGLHLFRLRPTAALAAAFLAIDGLALTLSRVAMLDIFLQFFVIAGFAALLRDQHLLWKDVPEGISNLDPKDVPATRRHWLLICGVFMGLAFATKWSATMPWGLACLWIWGGEMLRMRRLTGKWYAKFVPILARGLFALLLVPLFVYCTSYIGWFANWEKSSWAERNPGTHCMVESEEPCSTTELISAKVSAWTAEQKAIYEFHRDLEADHNYRAPAWTWFVMSRPVAFYYEGCNEGDADCVVQKGNVAEVLGLGNPFIWWMALLSYPLLAFFLIKRRDWRAGIILLFIMGQILPYFASPRTVFVFYMAPVIPFMALGLGVVAERFVLARKAWAARAMMLIAAAGFLIWSPVYYGWEIPKTWWDMIIWLPSWV